MEGEGVTVIPGAGWVEVPSSSGAGLPVWAKSRSRESRRIDACASFPVLLCCSLS